MDKPSPIEFRIARAGSILSNLAGRSRIDRISPDLDDCLAHDDAEDVISALMKKAQSDGTLRAGIKAAGFAAAWVSIYDDARHQIGFDF